MTATLLAGASQLNQRDKPIARGRSAGQAFSGSARAARNAGASAAGEWSTLAWMCRLLWRRVV